MFACKTKALSCFFSHVCVCMHACVCIYMCVYIYIYIYIYMFARMCVCVCARALKPLRSYKERFSVCGLGVMSVSTRSLMRFTKIQVEEYTTALGTLMDGMLNCTICNGDITAYLSTHYTLVLCKRDEHMISCTWTERYCSGNCVRYNNSNNKVILWRGIKLHELKKS
jgi:hypothetical protein